MESAADELSHIELRFRDCQTTLTRNREPCQATATRSIEQAGKLRSAAYTSHMSYYHEARQAKVRMHCRCACAPEPSCVRSQLTMLFVLQADLKTASLDNKRKAERRAELVTTQVTYADSQDQPPSPLPFGMYRSAPNRCADHDKGMRLVQTEEPAQLLRVDGRACKKFRNTEQYAALEALDGFIAWNGRSDNMIDRFDGRALLDFYREPEESVRKRPKTEAQLEVEEVGHAAVGVVAGSAYRLQCWQGSDAIAPCTSGDARQRQCAACIS